MIFGGSGGPLYFSNFFYIYEGETIEGSSLDHAVEYG